MLTWAILTLGAILCLVLLVKPSLGGPALGFAGLLILPVLASTASFEAHVDRSKTTDFCASCHVMKDYRRSLDIDDPTYLPAAHFQSGRVDRDHACFTCHTSYTMYGDWAAKMRGLRHMYVQYIGTVPDKIELYSPYQNRECLHCHEDTRAYLEAGAHAADDVGFAKLTNNQISCVMSGCHDKAHDVKNLHKQTFWPEPPAKAEDKKPDDEKPDDEKPDDKNGEDEKPEDKKPDAPAGPAAKVKP